MVAGLVAVTDIRGDTESTEPEFAPAGPGRRMGSLVGIAAALLVVGGIVALLLSADNDDVDDGDAASATRLVFVDQIPGGPPQDVPSALSNPLDDSFPAPLVDLNEVLSGGPPPDGIPPIDVPAFERVTDVDWLEDQEPVLALEIDGDARAYPVQVMTWHELVNDTFGELPVTVSFCPLCNSAIAYERIGPDAEVLDFGTSGLLYNSSLVMYDRQTESLWTHFTGEAVAGHLTGTQLELIPLSTVSWADFREANPDGLVLSRETGVERPYGENPYLGYDNVDSTPFAFRGEVDDRLPAQSRVLSVRGEVDAVVIDHEVLFGEQVVPFELEGRSLVALLVKGTASGLEAFDVAGGRDVGATGVFVPQVDGTSLTFRAEGDGFVDEETGSVWNILGEATAGPLAGRAMESVVHLDTFWFAIAAFSPDVRIVPR